MSAPFRASAAKRRGFTLIEVMVALLIALLILGTIFSLYNQYHRSLRRQQNQTEMQQNLRYAFSVLARDLAMTGYGFGNQRSKVYAWVDWAGTLTSNPMIVAGSGSSSDSITMVAAYDRVTSLTTMATAGASRIEIPAAAASEFNTYRRRVIYIGRTELARVTGISGGVLTISTSPSNTVPLRYPHPAGDLVERVKAVTYSVGGTLHSSTRPIFLRRSENLLAPSLWTDEAVASDIEWLKCSRSDNTVRVILRGVGRRPETGFWDAGFGDAYRRMSLTNNVYLRNEP